MEGRRQFLLVKHWIFQTLLKEIREKVRIFDEELNPLITRMF